MNAFSKLLGLLVLRAVFYDALKADVPAVPATLAVFFRDGLQQVDVAETRWRGERPVLAHQCALGNGAVPLSAFFHLGRFHRDERRSGRTVLVQDQHVMLVSLIKIRALTPTT
jgi:hypothetical protein